MDNQVGREPWASCAADCRAFFATFLQDGLRVASRPREASRGRRSSRPPRSGFFAGCGWRAKLELLLRR
eukprot:8969089-Pyramimonas_sp.AAC.1